MKYGQDSNSVRKLADIKNSVQVRLYTTDNDRIKEFMFNAGIEGSLRAKATWLAIEAELDRLNRINNTHHVEKTVTLTDDEFFNEVIEEIGITAERALEVYGSVADFLDAWIYLGKNEVIEKTAIAEPTYEVITVETTETVHTITPEPVIPEENYQVITSEVTESVYTPVDWNKVPVYSFKDMKKMSDSRRNGLIVERSLLSRKRDKQERITIDGAEAWNGLNDRITQINRELGIVKV